MKKDESYYLERAVTNLVRIPIWVEILLFEQTFKKFPLSWESNTISASIQDILNALIVNKVNNVPL